MERSDSLRLFARVVETASFSRAAQAEGVVQSTVTKQVAALEERLGAQLFRRTSRGLSVTEAGRRFYEQIAPALAELDAAEASVGQDGAAGRLRVTLPAAFGRMFVTPLLPQLLERYPGLAIEVHVTDRHVNLVEEGIDVAVRLGKLLDSTLVARRIGGFDAITVATPRYLELRGRPKRPQDLAQHACVVFVNDGRTLTWVYRGTQISPRGAFTTNDAEQIRAAIVCGLGVGYVPAWLVADELKGGTVVPLLADYAPPAYPIHAVSAQKRLPRPAKVFVEFLAEHFAALPVLNRKSE